jgi:hypothetical protein
MRFGAIICGAVFACLLAGCTQPAVSLKAPAFQDSANSVRDWDTIAQSIASGLAASGLLQPPQPSSAVAPAPIFIRVQAPDSTALRVVADALRADILQAGGVVALAPDRATVVNLNVTVLAWGPRVEVGLPMFLPTMNAEAVWTAAVQAGDHVVLQLRQPVYIHEGDMPLYAARVTLGPAASWMAAPPLARTVRYE